jgi:cation:H+ antiporter
MFVSILFLLGGLILIIFSANWLVDGASGIARRYGIPDLVIGLTIVAFGTSAPELTVTVLSALGGSTDIAIGNVLGSNIANILLILGISAIIHPLNIQQNTTWKEIPLSLLAAIVLGFMANDQLIDQHPAGSVVSRTDGLVLLAFFAIFLAYTAEIARTQAEAEAPDAASPLPLGKGLLRVAAGLAGLYFGGRYFVEGAVDLATLLGLSQQIIGLTIVAVGTSLPELATSVVAAYKRKADIAVGNIVGSNIFNVFFILGTTAVIAPLPFSPAANVDVLVAILASFLLFITTMTFGKRKVDRIEGVVFVGLYVLYIAYLISR